MAVIQEVVWTVAMLKIMKICEKREFEMSSFENAESKAVISHRYPTS